MMQISSQLAQTASEIGAVLAKLTPVERTVALGATFASILNEVVPLHLHQAHLQLFVHCATSAMSGASQEQKVTAARAFQNIIEAADIVDAETSTP